MTLIKSHTCLTQAIITPQNFRRLHEPLCQNEMLRGRCWRLQFKWGLHNSSCYWLSPTADVMHPEHRTVWWVYLTLGAKRLSDFSISPTHISGFRSSWIIHHFSIRLRIQLSQSQKLAEWKRTPNSPQCCVMYSVTCTVKSDQFTVQQNALHQMSVIYGLQRV